MQIMSAIRRALNHDGRPQREIAKAAGIHHVNLSQFKAGQRTLPLDTLVALAGVLGLEIRVEEKRKRQ